MSALEDMNEPDVEAASRSALPESEEEVKAAFLVGTSSEVQ